MVAKSNKTLQEALASLLQKHRLRPQDVSVTMIFQFNDIGSSHFECQEQKKESEEPINMNTIITSLANKTLILDKVKGMDQSLGSKTAPVPTIQARRGAVDVDVSIAGFYRSNPKQKNPAMRRAYDMEGLVELLNRAQGCSADDQRGLLKKEDLTIPNFLQLPLEEHDEEDEQVEEQRSADSLAFRSTENLGEPASNRKGDAANSSTSLLCSTEPDRKLMKECSNPSRETVV
ncbi:hypothetical protein QTP86_028994 [Hemibagrus guttatus]|nr:hypothetical protein QTP86_028994 [Hemibagrus guttatus]